MGNLGDEEGYEKYQMHTVMKANVLEIIRNKIRNTNTNNSGVILISVWIFSGFEF